MKIKVLYNSELIEDKETDFTEFIHKVWNELEKEFGFSIKNAKYEICTDDKSNIDIIFIYLNDKGYNDYKAWKYRVDRLEFILGSI
jgi:hypothetical protein